MSTIDDFLRDASPSQIAPLPTSHDKGVQARATVEWAQGRHQEMTERVRACHRIAGSVTDGYHGGEPPSREDLETAVVRLMAVVIDLYALSRQTIAACDAAIPARDEV